MLKFFTSLSFLYAFTIVVLLVYGFLYYRSFIKNNYQRRRFPLVFFLVGIACFSFLYFNIHAPLSLKTFSNLDHHFIRHDGFRVAGSIELGRTDTLNFKGSSFNRFLLSKKQQQVELLSAYSEDPLYVVNGESRKLLSACLPAENHRLFYRLGETEVDIKVKSDSSISLSIDSVGVADANIDLRKGASLWTLLKDKESFVNSASYTNDQVTASLKAILLLKDDSADASARQLKFFFSGQLFRQLRIIVYDHAEVSEKDIAFQAAVPDGSVISWGLGSLENNRNQFRVKYLAADSFALLSRYPVSYPLTEEDKNDWTKHSVTKFLASDAKDLQQMPAVFGEGFLFAPFSGDNTIDFEPVLLHYTKDRANGPLQLQAKFMNGAGKPIISNNQLILPAKAAGFSWVFSMQNSFSWNFGSRTIDPGRWQVLLFGTLALFFALVFASSLLKSANKLSWIWQLLSSVTLVLLTTRFFLYWRYKSFPPYEALDLPSQQQLNSFSNFGIIIATGVILSLVFGYSFLRWIYIMSRKKTASILGRSYHGNFTEPEWVEESKISERIDTHPLTKKAGVRVIYFCSWILILTAAGVFAALQGFDPTTCRHLAIGLVLCYFLFLYISYKHSPLVVEAEKSWWGISTSRTLDIIINNPVKILLSVSLLALFAFIDIGFAIIFLNFLLFNEAFLCINYAIAGLSAGSRRNAGLFGLFGAAYLLLFVINLVYGPYIFRYLLDLPQLLYTAGYFVFAILVAYTIRRILVSWTARKRNLAMIASCGCLFLVAFFFFPKEKILDKAAMTKYRIDVMTMPVEEAVEIAYGDGKTYEPVIRAAQNQWFINTFIDEKNNPVVNRAGFHLLPHAPQHKGAKYNAQATDLVASRFFIAEHGKWSVLLYVLLLMVPTTLLASFYKLYPDFTNRINSNYPTITAGFSLLNYLLITALLVILAATGRYIFFGQDLPFGSILSKQSILFPAILIVLVTWLFRRIPLEQYPNRRKLIPGAIVFGGLTVLLLFVKPVFNRNREFGAAGLAKDMDNYIELRLQPIFDHIDTSYATRRLPIRQKDKLFADTLRKMQEAGLMEDAGKFLAKEIASYTHSGFTRHLDQRKMLYLDLYSGRPQLAVNDNYFRIEPPPHLQQSWTGNIFSDTTRYAVSCWNASNDGVVSRQISSYTDEPVTTIADGLQLVFRKKYGEYNYGDLCLVNRSAGPLILNSGDRQFELAVNDSTPVSNPARIHIRDAAGQERLLVVEPDAFMRNLYVNGNRFYVYPMGSDFIWARNFAESVSSEYTAKGQGSRNAFVSLDAQMMDSLSAKIHGMMTADTSYHNGAEYGICIADGNGRLVAMTDFIKGMERPDPNDKAGFNRVIQGENGWVSQSLLRKQIGNINLLRMNPGPGSTLKPVVFTAIASQLKMDWDAFAAEGFSQKQKFFGGEKVAEYDFEKNNGRIASVIDYLRYSDNYYYSNLLLLGSYSKQGLADLLTKYFATQHPEAGFHWPYFSYNGKQYWLNGFENWPGYIDGKANFGSDSSFVSAGLFNNYGIYTYRNGHQFDRFNSAYDSLLFRDSYKRSGFILPEYALFDQKGTGMDNRKPNEVFMSSFRGHVKGSSQVMVPPVKMLDAFGKMISQNRNYALTLNPYANEAPFNAFAVDNGVAYNQYLSIVREKVFKGLQQALFNGTAARLGAMLKDGSPYYYYAKTGTTGDDESKDKSKLFAIIISEKDVTAPGFNFRKNRFYTIYFTSQHGPAKQNEEFQANIIRYVQQSTVFKRYMNGKDQ
jgi:hypothetical protein